MSITHTIPSPVGHPSATTPRPTGVSAACLDWAERLVVVGFYGWLVARLLLNYWAHGNAASLLLLPSEGLVVLFMLVRRRTDQFSRHPGEWLLAGGATCVPLLVSPGTGVGWLPVALPAVLLLMGIVVQLHAKLVLGRSFGCVPANRGLKRGGPYRFVRHPMYAGYLLSHAGFLLMHPTVWNLAVYALAFGLQIPRLLAEERLLIRDPDYRAYQSVVRHRLIPGVF